MGKTIPLKVIRNIIADILFKRSEVIESVFDDVCNKAEKEGRNLTDYESEIGVTAAGTRVMSDEVRCGNIFVKDALESILDQEEKLEVQKQIKEYIKKQSK